MPQAYIALVTISTFVNGTRVKIEPGETVTGLSVHDERELLRMGAIDLPVAQEANASIEPSESEPEPEPTPAKKTSKAKE